MARPTTGGEILFGTDVGFIPDYDPEEEYRLMQQAGMSARDILRALAEIVSRELQSAAVSPQRRSHWRLDALTVDD